MKQKGTLESMTHACSAEFNLTNKMFMEHTREFAFIYSLLGWVLLDIRRSETSQRATDNNAEYIATLEGGGGSPLNPI